jgi:voltage-gated potassium channel Kch
LTRISSLAAILVMLQVVPGAAQQKSFEGQEAAALRCANTLAFTAVALENAGSISPAEKEVMLGVTVMILERHVSGTWAQKKAALEVVRDRRGASETLDDFERLAQRCLKEFPIN